MKKVLKKIFKVKKHYLNKNIFRITKKIHMKNLNKGKNQNFYFSPLNTNSFLIKNKSDPFGDEDSVLLSDHNNYPLSFLSIHPITNDSTYSTTNQGNKEIIKIFDNY